MGVPEGDNEHVLLEFTEEIQMHVYPYVRRLFETNHLSEVEAQRVHALLLQPG